MKRVLVTGATGFIGDYLVKELLQHDFEVIASSANEAKAKSFSWYPHVHYIPFNLEHFDPAVDYFHFFKKPDKAIHLTWEGLPHYKSSFHIEINLPRQLNFLRNLIQNGLNDLTVTGTCFEYGMQEGCLREDMAVFPANSYAKAKNALREHLESLQQHYPFLLKWIRLFYIHGKGQNPNSLLSQLERALSANEQVFNMSGGEQVRDFLPVETVAAYIIKISSHQHFTGIINCCSGQPVTVRQLVENYLKNKNRTIHLNLGYYPYPDYEPMQFWGDNTKLNTIIYDH